MPEKKKVYFLEDDFASFPETPERNLWLAVIERAFKDYCFFFDKLEARHNHAFLQKKTVGDYMKKKCIAEITRLRWFIFEKSQMPFNLQYLVTELYEDSDNVLSALRKSAREQFARHVSEKLEHPIFKPIIDHIVMHTDALHHQAATVESTLRYKRYRLIN